ncbi:TonB-dependent receptor [Pseudochrobactrum sp. Wa41.01b-1]|uniref:TonB-dependent receptor n=1 Tax=Pseudochrobactrum sp. Wa41.01b-1 TaxID=2864102 RepID=UPI001C68A659|nr:TonB-dependent receptor [Pseudochrobactrum sp. Wa41.01b-1]QYM72101.1 TonB-dependent receptor [Pseudochrobactrum sp. Wa41.01b-1]
MTRNLLQHKKSILVLGTALTVFSLGNAALAQEKKQEPVQLKEILVTAGRTPIEEGKTGRAVTVITGKQLEQNQVRYVADALRMVPGFAVSRSGSKGGMTNIRVRGAEANHLLVMVDGVEMNAASGDAYDFGALQAEDIDRIEILRGPQSAFWGSNALAGVVNIITKGGKRDGFKISGTTEAGSQNSWLGGVLLQGGAENYDMALAASYRRTKGFNISNIGDEKDGDENLTLNGKVNIDLSETAKLDATLRYVKNRTDLDNSFFPMDPVESLDTYSKTNELLGSIGLTWTALDEALTQKLRFSGSDKQFEYTSHQPVSENKGSRYKASYQATYAFDTPSFADAHHKITGGVEWQQERFRQVATENDLSNPWMDPTQFEHHKRSMYSFIGEYNGEFADQFFVNLGLRHDVNKDFDDATTFSLSGAWAIPDTNARLHSSVGTGVTNPTFYEQFGFSEGFVGNPDLKPEKSLGWDIGLEYAFFDGLLVTDVTYFKQNLREEISTIYTGWSPTGVENLDGKSKRHGVELAATLNLFYGFTAGGAYTYTSSRNPDGTEAVRRPRHSGSVNVAYTFYEDRARLFGEAVFNGEMKDTGLRTLDKYTVVNIGGSYKFTDKLEGYARIENLFDKKYQEVYGYNTPGRGAFAGLKASF